MQYSIVNTKKLDRIALRLDAEYYRPDYLSLQKQLSKLSSITVRNTGAELDCSAFYPSIAPYYNFEKDGIPFLRVNEIQNGLLHISNDTAFLPQSILDENRNTIRVCAPGDLIIAKGGNSLAKVTLLNKDFEKYSACRDVIILRTHNLSKIKRYYLWMFLHSSVGQKLLIRIASQTGQPHLTLEAITQIEVPLFSDEFQNIFEWLYGKSQTLKYNAEAKYTSAQSLLLSEFGLANWHPKHRLTFVKNYSDTVQAGRIDAEYYQPQYEEIINTIKCYTGGWDTLGNLVYLNDKNFSPEEKKDYIYIELANLADNGEITDCIIEKGQYLPSRARRTVSTGDVIVSSVEGSLSSIALIDKEYDQALCSTGFYVINSKVFNSETLFLLMKSIVGQLQLKKGCSGTILAAISKNEFSDIILPVISEEKQIEIQQNVIKSFNLRKQSKYLLECAKRAVEIAIERDEETAMDWLRRQTQGNMQDVYKNK